jgi:hypothetical protein
MAEAAAAARLMQKEIGVKTHLTVSWRNASQWRQWRLQ